MSNSGFRFCPRDLISGLGQIAGFQNWWSTRSDIWPKYAICFPIIINGYSVSLIFDQSLSMSIFVREFDVVPEIRYLNENTKSKTILPQENLSDHLSRSFPLRFFIIRASSRIFIIITSFENSCVCPPWFKEVKNYSFIYSVVIWLYIRDYS